MKRLLILIGLIALPLVAGSVTQSLRFGSSDLTLYELDGYTVVELAGGVAQVNPGLPRLPRVVQSVSIPAGAEPVGVELVAEDWLTLPGEHKVIPSQPDVPLPMPGRTFTPTEFPPDPTVYGSSQAYPDVKVRLLGAGTMAGYRIAYVELWPVRYSPAAGILELSRRLTYRLTYRERDQGSVPTETQQAVFGSMVRSLVANPNDVNRFAPRVQGLGASFALPPGHFEYVVITEPPLDTVFERLAEWKTLRGVPATVVTRTWINANYAGYDMPDKFRNFIKDAYQTWGTMYVLLGGAADHKTSGENVLPGRDAWYMRQGIGGYPDEDTVPCDLYFGGLDGTWDADGDHVYGERLDSADMVSEVFIGRASVSTVAQARNFVDKSITYETNPPAGYLRKMLLPTAILWSSYNERMMQDSLARMTPPGWLDAKLYERSGNLSLAAMRDSMNSGFGLGNWVGHGNEDGIYMGSSPYMNSTTADGLVNGYKLGIHASIGCFCGAWDETPGGDCFSEHLMNRVGGGAVGIAMNTRYGYGAYTGGGYVPGPSERLDTVFFTRMVAHGEYHVGQALAFSRAYWAPYADSTGRYDMQRFCIYELNLLGDPELSVWTEEPQSVAAAHPGVITLGNNVPYTVTVTDGSEAPVESALVLLWKGDEVYTKGRTSAGGQVTLLVSTRTPGPMTLTANARNHYLLIDTVQVISANRYVCHLRSSILDPAPGGNGDSILNPGETVKAPTWVKNWGSQVASSVTARLWTLDANVQITDSVKSFGNIPAGDSAYTGENGFGFSVASGLANGYAVVCSLACRDALDSVWVSGVTFHAGTPVLVRGTVTVRDSGIGNGNGKVDPGETADLEVEIRNTGMGHGYNCQAVLRSFDARLSVLDSTAPYGTIRAGMNASNTADRFRVQADRSIPAETPVPCTLLLSADGGYEFIQAFDLVVGEIRAVDPIPDGPRTPPRYYAYDDVDAAYEPHPTYDWVEIKSQGTQLTYAHNDDVLVVSLPNVFGPLKFYGERYTQLSVSADGWLCPGNYTSRHYENSGLPNPETPPGMICANWDDLYPSYQSQGHVYYFHDEPNHRFIVEYDSVAYYDPRTTRDKFEVIIYDTTVTTFTGDNAIVVQYMTANYYSSATFGIEDPGRAIAIQALFDNNYHRGCAPLAPGRAIAYTTDPPNPTAIADENGLAAALANGRFVAYPNPLVTGPLGHSATLLWNVEAPGRVALRVYDAAGRQVRNLVDTRMQPGRYSVSWDGTADNGQPIAAGIYFYRLETPSGTCNQKVVVSR